MPKGSGEEFILIWEDFPYEEEDGKLRNVRRAAETDPEKISLRKESGMRPIDRQRVNVMPTSSVPNEQVAIAREVTLIEAHLPELLRTVLAETISKKE